jgi:hypothetical protein
VSRIGDSASVQAVTRVNAEQASTMRRPTRQPFRGRLIRLGEVEQEYAQPLRRGSGESMYTISDIIRLPDPRAVRDGPPNNLAERAGIVGDDPMLCMRGIDLTKKFDLLAAIIAALGQRANDDAAGPREAKSRGHAIRYPVAIGKSDETSPFEQGSCTCHTNGCGNRARISRPATSSLKLLTEAHRAGTSPKDSYWFVSGHEWKGCGDDHGV